jgi:hypothetical protein
VQAAMDAMFMDRYNVTVTYNEKVERWRAKPQLIYEFVPV